MGGESTDGGVFLSQSWSSGHRDVHGVAAAFPLLQEPRDN